MTANINPKTGIAYGVTAISRLQDWVWDEFVTNGHNDTYAYWVKEWEEDHPGEDIDDHENAYDEYCPEEECYSLSTEGMELAIGWLGGAPLVWVFFSPHTTETRECCTCVPNAGDLDSPGDGTTCYTLPKEWFFRED